MSRLSSLGYSPIASGERDGKEAAPRLDPRTGGNDDQPDVPVVRRSAFGRCGSTRTAGSSSPAARETRATIAPADRARMEMILRGKKLGFTLAEISDLIGGKGANDSPDLEERLQPQQIVNQIGHLERQREEIESAIARLGATHQPRRPGRRRLSAARPCGRRLATGPRYALTRAASTIRAASATAASTPRGVVSSRTASVRRRAAARRSAPNCARRASGCRPRSRRSRPARRAAPVPAPSAARARRRWR